MSLITLLLVILVVVALVGLPPVSGHPYGYTPSGLLLALLAVLLVLVLLGRL